MVNIGSLRKEYKIKLLDVIIQAATIKYLEEKITKQEAMIKELIAKADLATGQVQSIACRALDTSAQRFVTLNSGKTEEKAT